MRRPSRAFLIWLALLFAMPVQAYALYVAAECPMAALHGDMPMSGGDCEGCDQGGCAFMNVSVQPQAGPHQSSGVASPVEQALALSFDVTAFSSRTLSPPDRPPRFS